MSVARVLKPNHGVKNSIDRLDPNGHRAKRWSWVKKYRHTPRGPIKEKERKNGGEAARISETFCQGYSCLYSVSELRCMDMSPVREEL